MTTILLSQTMILLRWLAKKGLEIMANLLNFLLNEELADVSSYTKDVEIPRLSKKMDGGKFVIKVRALTTKETDALPFDKCGIS